MTEIWMYGLVFVVLGVVLYFVDERFGAPGYRKVWNFFHKNPLAEDPPLGFICGRRTRSRVLPAAVLTVAVCFLLRTLGEHDPIALALKGTFLMFPGLLIGFALGGLLRRNRSLVDKAERGLGALDELEAGKVDLGGAAQAATAKVTELGERAARLVSGEGESPAPEAPTHPSTPVAEPTPPKAAVRPMKDVIREFNKRS